MERLAIKAFENRHSRRAGLGDISRFLEQIANRSGETEVPIYVHGGRWICEVLIRMKVNFGGWKTIKCCAAGLTSVDRKFLCFSRAKQSMQNCQSIMTLWVGKLNGSKTT